MVDLSGGPDGPIEHGFSNSVFIIPGIIILGLSGKVNRSWYWYPYFYYCRAFTGYCIVFLV